MQDGEHDALPIAGTSSDSRYFVVATLAAIVLAGGAFVYRSRPLHPRQAEHDHHGDKVPLRAQSQLDDELNAPQPPSLASVNDQESKESKRSKDRRRRGKDPLKEIFKSGKKSKGITLAPSRPPAPCSGSEDHDAADHSGTGIVQPPSDHFPARKSPVGPIPRSTGKRPQRDQQSNSSTAAMSAGTPSVTHSRGPSDVSESHHDRNNRPSLDPSSTSSASDDGHRSHSPLTSQDDREGGDERHSGPPLSQIQAHQAVLAPAPRPFATESDLQAPVSFPPRSVPSPALHSSSGSSSTNTTTTSSVISPATSPTLSQTSPSFPPAAGSCLTIGPAPTNLRVRNSLRNQTQPTSNVKKTQSPCAWDWDGANDHTTTVSPEPPTQENIVNHKPPRLQPKGSKATNAPLSFSAAAAAHVPNVTIHVSSSMTSATTSHISSSMSDDGNGNTSMSSSASHLVSMSRALAATSSSSTGATGPSSSTSRTSIPPSPSLSAVAEAGDEQAIHLTFPTLNPTITTPDSSGSNDASSLGTRARPANGNSQQQQNNNNNSLGHAPSTPKRVPTPRDRRPPTPSGSTPPPNSCNSSNSASSMPALSTQTQLASLRGALEAARLREEKNKADLERYVKEMDILRWENMNWRRGEAELQAHIQQLMHQLQTYAALFATMAPHLNSQFQRQQQQGNGNTTPNVAGSTSGTLDAASAATPIGSAGPSAGSISGSGTTSTPQSQPQTPSSQQQQQHPSPLLPPPPPMLPLHIQMLSSLHLNSMPSPVMGGSGMMSPTAGMQPPSPFFPYSAPGPHPHNFHAPQHPMMAQFPPPFPHVHPLPQSPVQPQSSPHQHQANMFAMLFPHQQTISMHSPNPNLNAQASSSSASMGSLSRPSSNADASSVGSLSPDLGGSPSPAFGMPVKRRSKTRAQAQAANGRVGGRAAWEDVGDGWIGPTIGEGEEGGIDDVEDDYEEHEGGFNEILADAILKRPDSIRVKSSSKRPKLELGNENDALKDTDRHDEELSASRNSDRDRSSEVEQLKEFTFPSLSDLGNVQQRSFGASQSNGDNSVASSSSPSSPTPVSTPASDNLFGLETEEPHVTLPSVEEQVETGETHIEIDDPLINADHYDHKGVLSSISSPESETTPRKEKLEPSLTESVMEEVASIETTTTGDVALDQ